MKLVIVAAECSVGFGTLLISFADHDHHGFLVSHKENGRQDQRSSQHVGAPDSTPEMSHQEQVRACLSVDT